MDNTSDEQEKGNKEAAKKGAGEGASSEKKGFKLPPLSYSTSPEASQDPLTSLMKIAKDKDIDPEVRQWLFDYAVTRFKNRRQMAFIALLTIIAMLFFLGFGALYDGLSECVASMKCTGILASMQKIEDVLVWGMGFLASIVAAYYGVSSFRPSS